MKIFIGDPAHDGQRTAFLDVLADSVFLDERKTYPLPRYLLERRRCACGQLGDDSLDLRQEIRVGASWRNRDRDRLRERQGLRSAAGKRHEKQNAEDSNP